MAPSVPDDPSTDRLRSAELEVVGRFATASNATLLVRLRDEDGSWPELPLDPDGDLLLAAVPEGAFAIYKPELGEAPLWDFPDGTLHLRELAAYRIDRMLGWGLVPPTVVREDAPHGVGAVQAFVAHDPDDHYFALLESAGPGVLDQLRRMVVFDLVIDNADRKAGHVLRDRVGRIRLVDHGVSFHVEDKLRTVAWHFVGEPVPGALRRDVARLVTDLGPDAAPLGDLLSEPERRRLVERCRDVADLAVFPPPRGPRPYPWPLV